MQATSKNSAPFLTTTRTLTNVERFAQWQRRKQASHDIEQDDQRYLLAWIVMAAIGAGLLLYAATAQPNGCIWVWNYNGINEWCGS